MAEAITKTEFIDLYENDLLIPESILVTPVAVLAKTVPTHEAPQRTVWLVI